MSNIVIMLPYGTKPLFTTIFSKTKSYVTTKTILKEQYGIDIYIETKDALALRKSKG